MLDKTRDVERLTFRLNLLAQLAIEANDGLFRARTGLSIREIRILRLVDDNPGITFVELNRAAHLERTMISRIIQALIKAELVQRVNDPGDARRFSLFATEGGRRLRQAASLLSDSLEEILVQPFDAAERAQFEAHLSRLADWVRSDGYRAALEDWKASS